MAFENAKPELLRAVGPEGRRQLQRIPERANTAEERVGALHAGAGVRHVLGPKRLKRQRRLLQQADPLRRPPQ